MRSRLALLLAAATIAAAACASSAGAPGSASPSSTAAAGSTGADTPDTGLAGTGWEVISIGGAATLPEAKPSITFGADGSISGSSSCNTYSGTYTVEGDKLSVSPELVSTMMACEPAINTQEQAFTIALTGATNWAISEAGELHLTGTSDIVARLVAQAEGAADAVSDLAGTAWALGGLGGTTVAEVVPTIAFGPDGAVSGSAGCNAFSGTYEVRDASVAFGPLMSTKKACGEPADGIEMAFLDALASVSSWSIDPQGRLVLGGAAALTFSPA